MYWKFVTKTQVSLIDGYREIERHGSFTGELIFYEAIRLNWLNKLWSKNSYKAYFDDSLTYYICYFRETNVKEQKYINRHELVICNNRE